MSLDMLGHIDDVFRSVQTAQRSSVTGSYVDGKWVTAPSVISNHRVTLQPVTLRELDNINFGGERINDTRKVYVNDGDLFSIAPSDTWEFSGIDGTFKTIGIDNRASRNYCKLIVVKNDD